MRRLVVAPRLHLGVCQEVVRLRIVGVDVERPLREFTHACVLAACLVNGGEVDPDGDVGGIEFDRPRHRRHRLVELFLLLEDDGEVAQCIDVRWHQGDGAPERGDRFIRSAQAAQRQPTVGPALRIRGVDGERPVVRLEQIGRAHV